MVDYYTLAEQLMELHVALHIIPINQELAALERGMFFALNFLMFHKRSAYPKELSRGMGVSSARVAALLNHLEKEGLIQRRPDPKDNRQVIVSLTENGIHAIRQKRKEILETVAQTLEELGPEDAQEFLRIQQKLAEKFSLQIHKGVSTENRGRKETNDSTA